jgi:hypothetical protein
MRNNGNGEKHYESHGMYDHIRNYKIYDPLQGGLKNKYTILYGDVTIHDPLTGNFGNPPGCRRGSFDYVVLIPRS